MIAKTLALLVAVVLLATPLAAVSQQAGKISRIAVLANEPWAPIDGLRDGLRQLGYVEARTMVIDYRWSQGRTDQFAALAAESVDAKADVIVMVGTPAALAHDPGHAAAKGRSSA